MSKVSRPYKDFVKEYLQDPEEARGYLEIAIEEYEQDGDKDAFLLALRDVVDAQGGIGRLAQQTGLNREHLYRMLSKGGNPRLDTIGRVLHGLGFRLSVQSIQSLPDLTL